MDPAAVGSKAQPSALPEDGIGAGAAQAGAVGAAPALEPTEAEREAARLATQQARPFMNISTGFTAAGMQALVQQAFAEAAAARSGGGGGDAGLTLPGPGGAAAPGDDAALVPAKDVKKLDLGKLKKGDGVVKLPAPKSSKSFDDAWYASELDDKYGPGKWQVRDADGNQLEPDDPGFREGAHALWTAHNNKKIFQGKEQTTEVPPDFGSVTTKVDVRMDKKGEKAEAVVGGLGGMSSKATEPVADTIQRIEDRYGVDIQDGTKAWTSKDLALLEKSFEKLGPEEKKLLDGVVVRRDEQIPQTEKEKKDGDLAGTYKNNSGTPDVLTLDDTAFTSDEQAISTIIHEVGHGVIANRPGALDAFKAPDKATGPLTMYGEHTGSIEERFAEAFAIWKTDPKFLEEQAPEVFRFFEEGKHLAEKK